MKKILFIVIAITVILTLWGCSKTEKTEVSTEELPGESELTMQQRLAVDFLFKLVKNYGDPLYTIEVYGVKMYTEDGEWYYISADAKIDDERRRYGNSIMFRIDEEIRFTSKESSAYKFLTEENKAADRGEDLDLTVITDELTKVIAAQQEVDKSQ